MDNAKGEHLITADTLKTLTTFTAPSLSRAINLAGYRDDSFTSAEFVGMTNGLQFCYRCTYVEDNAIRNTKVFLDYDPTAGSITADY